MSRPGSVIWRKGEWPWLLLLLGLTAIVWCAGYGRWSAQTWTTPITYTTDAWWGMANAKAAATGEIVPVWTKKPHSFGAPFAADWNDYPSPDEGLLAWMAVLTRTFGVGAGANMAVLTAHLFASLAFYYVCRRLRYDHLFSVATALLFSLSRYAFSRGLLHLGLTYYWHIPFGILVVWWCLRRAGLSGRGRWSFSIAVAVLHAVQNPYYTGMFMQLLGGAFVYHLARRSARPRITAPLILLGVTVTTFLLMNVDTFVSRAVNGPNPTVVQRNYSGLEFYALKPVEMLLPVVHRIGWLHNWARESYYAKTMLIGEAGSPYLGIIGIAALGWLVGSTFRAVSMRARTTEIPSHFWLVLWVLAYSIVGGVNGVLGFVLELFRGTNRYSIVILTLVLLFLARQLTRITRRWNALGRTALATAIVALGLFDQIPPALTAGIPSVAQQVSSDREIIATVEAQLPPGATLFQMPVVDFPEVGPLVGMGDYEHFRPYLYSKTLRYSYGSVKGRSREAWQKEAATLPAPRMVAMLERYGFDAIWINRKGYADGAAALINDLRSAGRANVLGENPDYLCLALQPAREPELPPEFARGWHRLEIGGDQDWRWSSGAAEMVLYGPESAAKQVRLVFQITTVQPRRLKIVAANETLAEMTLAPDQPPRPIELALVLQPGANHVRLETEVPGELPANGDPRTLAFCIRNFRVLD